MSRDHPEIRFRAPPAVKRELERLAERNGRSLAAEVVDRLIRSVEAGDAPQGLVALLHDYAGRLNGIAAFLSDPTVQAALRASSDLSVLANPPSMMPVAESEGADTPARRRSKRGDAG